MSKYVYHLISMLWDFRVRIMLLFHTSAHKWFPLNCSVVTHQFLDLFWLSKHPLTSSFLSVTTSKFIKHQSFHRPLFPASPIVCLFRSWPSFYSLLYLELSLSTFSLCEVAEIWHLVGIPLVVACNKRRGNRLKRHNERRPNNVNGQS